MSDYTLHDKVPIAGMYDKEREPIVELGCIQTIPAHQTLLDGCSKPGEERTRKARVALDPDEAREVADALYKMADKMEE